MRFKKIYLEITNNCNLNCSFCIHNTRPKKFMSMEEFKTILTKIKPYTKYLYFHILGEPLLHPQINEFIDLASKDFSINITTNGYFLSKIVNNKNIRQINISLQSYDKHLPLEEYLNNIIINANKLHHNNTIINYRLWALNDTLKAQMKDILLKHYTFTEKGIYLSEETMFIWPSLSNTYSNPNGTCKGLITHMGILVDGTIIPCCLDSNGLINLGNIFKDNLEDILNSAKVNHIIEGFKHHQKYEKLCQKCNFYDRIDKQKERDYYG